MIIAKKSKQKKYSDLQAEVLAGEEKIKELAAQQLAADEKIQNLLADPSADIETQKVEIAEARASRDMIEERRKIASTANLRKSITAAVIGVKEAQRDQIAARNHRAEEKQHVLEILYRIFTKQAARVILGKYKNYSLQYRAARIKAEDAREYLNTVIKREQKLREVAEREEVAL